MMIRKACLDDAPAMARVHVDTWRTAYRGIIPEATLANLSYEQREERWRQILRSSRDTRDKGLCTYVAVAPTGQVVGFARGGPERTGDSTYRGELEGIYILSHFQRQGIGRCLVMTIAEHLTQAGIDSMLVWVLSDNSPARKFYEMLGGQQVREKQREIGGVMFTEVAYGWTNTNILIRWLP